MSDPQVPDQMLATFSLTPRGEYVFVFVDEAPAGTHPFVVIRDDDMPTVALEKSEAEAVGLPVDKTCAYPSFSLQADLDSIGVTAIIVQILSARSTIANPIACACHDHFFVQADRVVEAAQLLIELGESARGWLPHN